MSYESIASYYIKNGFNSFETMNSCWAADSTYSSNYMPLYQYNVEGYFDTFTPSSFETTGFMPETNFNFGWGGFSDWSFGNISFPWQKKSEGSKSNFSGSSEYTRNGLLSVEAWDAHMRGKVKSTKTCNEDYISELQPKMQEKVRKLEAFARSKGITFRICSGYRTPQKQQSLIDKYGTRRAASVNGSPHRSGRAIDISTNGILTEAQCTMLGKYAESIGMRWGGRWGGPGSSTQRERWHFDIPA